MNRIAAVTLMLLITSTSALAEGRRTLGGGGEDAKNGGFGGPEIQISTINGKEALFYGGKGGWLMNGKYYVGGAAYGASLNNSADSMGYGGLIVGRMFNPNGKIHFSADVLIGRGTVYDNLFNSDSFSIVEPGIDISFNLSRKSTLNIGVSQKFVTGDFLNSGYTASSLSKSSFRINLLFGNF